MNKKVNFWEFFQGLGKTFMLPVNFSEIWKVTYMATLLT